MRLGCFASLDQAPLVKAAGFDFLEVSVRDALRGEEASVTWDASAPDVAKLPLPVEAANNLMPPNRAIIGPARDFNFLQDYMQRVAKRAERLGIKSIGFGSGAARKRPEEVDEASGHRELEEFTRMAGEVCAHHGVALLIEQLSHHETNTVNTLVDSLSLVRRVSRPNVAALVDTYQWARQGDSDQAVLSLGRSLRHVHVAEPVGRVQPGGHGPSSDKSYDFARFFGLLKAMGYDGRISIEATEWLPSLEAGVGPAAKFLRQAWDRAGRSS